VMDLLLRCVLVLATVASLLRLIWADLYTGPFMKVNRVDLAKAVSPDTVRDTGGLCFYPWSLNLLEVSFMRPLTWEYWQLVNLY
jgi:hypothetical protein